MLFRTLLVVLSCAGLSTMANAQTTPDAAERYIQIPGLPPIAIPPSVRAPRQRDRIDTPRPAAPEAPQAALLPEPVPAKPVVRDRPAIALPPPPLSPEKRLADLYERLAKAADGEEAQGIVGALERQWLFTSSDTAGLIMTRALGALQRQEMPLALELLDKLVELEPQWAEAWNKRATVRFMSDDYKGSMADISHVLTLDPRHFGALMGMGTILQRSGNDKRALEAYRRVHDIYPALDSVKKIIDTLAPDVDGRDI